MKTVKITHSKDRAESRYISLYGRHWTAMMRGSRKVSVSGNRELVSIGGFKSQC